ncbi:MAG: glycosyltransferase family 39 protein [Planctomycetes bacterium]|nr:glycosyltransferase family 39 protein [Planctomycetota bacterium]
MPAPLSRILLFALLAGHFAWLLSHFEPAYSSPDASGYFVQARLIATTGSTALRPESPLQYTGVPWLETADGDFESRYPPGLPLLLAAVFWLLGPTAALLVVPLLGTLSVLLVFLFTRRIAGERHALLAALLFSVVPIANRQALHADAHSAATACLVAGLWLLLRWAERPSVLRALLAGFVFGLLPAIRYPEGLAGLGALLFLVGHALREPRRWRAVAAAAAGALAPLLLLAVHQRLAFGAWGETGYALTNEQSAFAWEALAGHLAPYLGALFREGLGLFLPLGLAGMLVMLALRESRVLGAALLGSVLPLFLLYSAYYWGRAGDPTMRFFLPILPLFFAAGVWLWREAAKRTRFRRAAYGALVALVLAHVAAGVPGSAQRMAREEVGTGRGAAIAAWLAEHARPGDVVIANRAVQGSLEFFGTYRLVDDRFLPGGPRRAELRTTDPDLRFLQDASGEERPSPQQHAKGARLRWKYAGKSEAEQASLAVADVLAWAAGADVYWISAPLEVERFEELLGQGGVFEAVAAIALPGARSRLCDLLGVDLAQLRLPYWVAEEPLVVHRWRR